MACRQCSGWSPRCSEPCSSWRRSPAFRHGSASGDPLPRCSRPKRRDALRLAADYAPGSSRLLEAAELGGAAQGVGHVAGGAEGVDEAEKQEAAAVDAEHGRARPVDDRDAGVYERAPAHQDPAAAVALYLVARAEPAAEHGDDLAGRHVLAWHL